MFVNNAVGIIYYVNNIYSLQQDYNIFLLKHQGMSH